MIKTLLLSAMLVLSPALIAGQDIIEKVFQKYSGLEGAASVRISGRLLKMLADMDKSEQELNKIAASLNSITILHIPEALVQSLGLDFYEEIVPGIRTENYNEIMRVQKPGQQILIIADDAGETINELIVVVGGERDNTLICIRGKLNMNQLSSLAGVDVPGMDQLINLQNR